MSWRFGIVLLIGLMLGCTNMGYRPPPGAIAEPVHGDSGGNGGSGAGM